MRQAGFSKHFEALESFHVVMISPTSECLVNKPDAFPLPALHYRELLLAAFMEIRMVNLHDFDKILNRPVLL